MSASHLRVFRGEESTCSTPTSRNQEQVSARLGEILPLLADAVQPADALLEQVRVQG